MRPTCRTCGANIMWVLTEGSKFMPVDPMPVSNGNVEIIETADGYRARVLTDLTSVSDHVSRYRSHFATCADAELHRKRGRK